MATAALERQRQTLATPIVNEEALIQHISAKQGLEAVGIQIAFNNRND